MTQHASSHAASDHPRPTDIQHALRGTDYPCSKRALVDRARANQAGDEILQVIERLPEQDYDSPAAVSKAMRPQ